MRTFPAIIILWLIWGACCRAQTPPTISIGPAKPDPKIISITQKDWDSLPLKERQALADYAKQYEILQNRPWEAMNNPANLLDLAQQSFVPEPFPAPILDTLQAALPRFQDPKQGTTAAAILYRYGRPAGYDYLAKRLKDHADPDAAFVFALNQDAAQVAGVLTVLTLHPKDDPDFIAALGDWHDPSIKTALWDVFQKQPDDVNLLLAVANQGVQDALPQARRLYFSSPAQDTTKTYAGTSIVKLVGVAQAPKVWQYLLTQVKLGPLSAPLATDGEFASTQRDDVIDNAGELRIPETLPTLRAVIGYYVKHGSGLKPGSTYYGTSADDLAVDAAQAIARMHDRASAALAVRLLVRLRKEPFPDPALVLSAANAALDLGGSESIVQSVIGKDELARTLAKRKLKVLPRYLMPENVFKLPPHSPTK